VSFASWTKPARATSVCANRKSHGGNGSSKTIALKDRHAVLSSAKNAAMDSVALLPFADKTLGRLNTIGARVQHQLVITARPSATAHILQFHIDMAKTEVPNSSEKALLQLLRYYGPFVPEVLFLGYSIEVGVRSTHCNYAASLPLPLESHSPY
jgi:hypothetical protein